MDPQAYRGAECVVSSVGRNPWLMKTPQITVLDGFTLNSGDLSWGPLRALGACQIHERTPPGEVVARCAESELVLTNKVVLDAGTLGALPRLRYIGVLATGSDVVDLEAARERGVVVTNVPAYSTASVAQLVFGLLLELTLHVGGHSRRVREGAWTACQDFSFRDVPLVELAGKTFGILGLGRIGTSVAELATAMGMRVIATTRTRPRATLVPVEYVSLDSLFRRSDVVSLHCPLTAETRHVVDAVRLARMKPDAYLINTARGALIDETALAQSLREGRLGGAGLDVLSVEPPASDHPLLGAPRCVLTPHLGWATTAARQRLMSEVVENVRAFLAGHPRNVVA